TFAWGIAVLIAWVGWGELVRGLLDLDEERVGWGLRAGWGMAVTLAISGILQACNVGDSRALSVLVLIGLGIGSLRAWEWSRRPRLPGNRYQFLWTDLLLGLLLIYLYATSIVAWDLNWWDDLPNYLVYIQKILHTGTVVEPFSLRRIVTYGGQQTLQATL